MGLCVAIPKPTGSKHLILPVLGVLVPVIVIERLRRYVIWGGALDRLYQATPKP